MADGEIITIPLGLATFCNMAMVTPEQSPPMMALTRSEVTSRSAAATAAAESMQVVSPRTATTCRPPSNAPLSLTSLIARSAPSAMDGVNDSIGPVKPNSTPSLTSSANAAPSGINISIEIATTRFIESPPMKLCEGKLCEGGDHCVRRSVECTESSGMSQRVFEGP